MVQLLGLALVVAGALQVLLATRIWTGGLYRSIPWFKKVFPFGTEIWTMPLPIACNGIVFMGIGGILLLPHSLLGIALGVMLVAGAAEIVVALWQPKWAIPPSLRNRVKRAPGTSRQEAED
jgi:hypothetical protein